MNWEVRLTIDPLQLRKLLAIFRKDFDTHGRSRQWMLTARPFTDGSGHRWLNRVGETGLLDGIELVLDWCGCKPDPYEVIVLAHFNYHCGRLPGPDMKPWQRREAILRAGPWLSFADELYEAVKDVGFEYKIGLYNNWVRLWRKDDIGKPIRPIRKKKKGD